MIKVNENVRIYSSLADLPEAARDLLRSREDFFLSEEWFKALIRYTSWSAHAIRIYVASCDDSVTGILAAGVVTPTHWFVRSQLASLTNFYTMRFMPILANHEHKERTLDALADAVSSERPRWDVIEFRCLPEDDIAIKTFLTLLRKKGLSVHTYFQFENWYRPTERLSSNDYFASLPSQLRHTIARKERKIKREHRVEFNVFRTPNELARGLADYQKVYASSWKEPELYPDFIPHLLDACARKGILRLALLYVDGDPAAAQIWFVAGSQATIYKLAYDERYTSSSVGSILTKYMFESTLENDNVSEIDFGSGSDPYKLDWVTNHRNLIGVIAFNKRSFRGACAYALYSGRELMKAFRKR